MQVMQFCHLSLCVCVSLCSQNIFNLVPLVKWENVGLSDHYIYMYIYMYIYISAPAFPFPSPSPISTF
jgi:hypothetical protein